MYNKLEQLDFKLEKIIGNAGKVRKIICLVAWLNNPAQPKKSNNSTLPEWEILKLLYNLFKKQNKVCMFSGKFY